MSKQNLSSLGDAIQAFLKQNRLDKKIDTSSLTVNWKQIAGEMIAKHTTRLFIKDHTLFLQVDSSALKNELHYLKGSLIKNINQHLGKELVKELILL
jgi:predicted nucleic acid-binding Zn ribbon protein